MRVEKRDLQSCTCMINWEDLDESYPTILKATLRELQNSWISLSNFWFCGKNDSEHHFTSLHFIFKKGNIKTSTFPDFSLQNIKKNCLEGIKKHHYQAWTDPCIKKPWQNFTKSLALYSFFSQKTNNLQTTSFDPLNTIG